MASASEEVLVRVKERLRERYGLAVVEEFERRLRSSPMPASENDIWATADAVVGEVEQAELDVALELARLNYNS
ncbi:MAG: hypothetical protein PVJ27_05175 [Candidatus Brocadiaceae bacterium]|jgi:hypothetical protein